VGRVPQIGRPLLLLSQSIPLFSHLYEHSPPIRQKHLGQRSTVTRKLAIFSCSSGHNARSYRINVNPARKEKGGAPGTAFAGGVRERLAPLR
jgi:hypothetical protein